MNEHQLVTDDEILFVQEAGDLLSKEDEEEMKLHPVKEYE